MIDLKDIQVSAELQQLIRSDVAWHYRIVPMKMDDTHYYFYVDQTSDALIVEEELGALLGKLVILEGLPKESIQRLLGR